MYGIDSPFISLSLRLTPPVYRYLFACALTYKSYFRLHLHALPALLLLLYTPSCSLMLTSALLVLPFCNLAAPFKAALLHFPSWKGSLRIQVQGCSFHLLIRQRQRDRETERQRERDSKRSSIRYLGKLLWDLRDDVVYEISN